jgi:hypothetical protein
MSLTIREYCNLYKDEIAVRQMNKEGKMESKWLSELSPEALELVIRQFEKRDFYPFRAKTDLERRTDPGSN